MIPVVMIHNGYADYLQYSIASALKNNKVVFIGNTNPGVDHENFEFVDVRQYLSGANEFAKTYVHMNTTPAGYELFCYSRWFILREFMKDRKLSCVFYIDSDVMLFADVNDEWHKYEMYDMTLLHRTAAISSYMTSRGIGNFCDMLMNIYGNQQSYDFNKIASHFQVRQRFGLAGGVCDMTLFEYFHYNDELGGGPGRVGEMMAVIDGKTYDHNINTPDNDYRMSESGIKDVYFINKVPFVTNTNLNMPVEFLSFHCQGGAKQHMREIYERTT